MQVFANPLLDGCGPYSGTIAMKRILTILTLLLTFSSGNSEAFDDIISVTDIGLESSFQDTSLGHHKKGRADIAADFDLDGYIDFFIGNPGDESIILRNVPGIGSQRSFELSQVLLVGDLAWGGVAFDYDNDGDYDLFVTNGGNEGIGLNHLYRNDWILNGVTTGELLFTDVTSEAGVAGPVPGADLPPGLFFEPSDLEDDCTGEEMSPSDRPRDWNARRAGRTDPVPTASANAAAADYDRDGDVDIFVNGNIHEDSILDFPELVGRNTLWRNNGDGTFTDVTYEAGLGSYLAMTRHSVFLDYDNDTDQDLYENNFNGMNILWRNNGDGTFSDVTTEVSMPGHDLHFPHKSFACAAADLNNDGWEDIIGFMRGPDDARHGSPYEDGHTLFINHAGMFENIAESTVLNDNYVAVNGVMGCMVADVSGDGYPDIYVGNGGPHAGVADQFFTSVVDGGVVSYVDNTSLIDFPAEIPDGFPVPPYPYRTHGVTGIDVDRDGILEIGVVNGGTASGSREVREPNRLFRVALDAPATFRVRPVGNGFNVSKDAIGTRIVLEVSKEGGEPWQVWRTLYGGNAFSAQNGFELHFYLADADHIDQMMIIWPDGVTTTLTEDLAMNSAIVVSYDEVVTGVGPAVQPGSFRLDQNYPNPFNPSTTIRYQLADRQQVVLTVFDVLGRAVATLVNEIQEPGLYNATWNAELESSGVYFYQLKAGSAIETRKLILSK